MRGTRRTRQRDREAADWFVRLSGPHVTEADMEAFQTWRADPDRRAAYARIEQAWVASGELRRDPDILRALTGVPDRRRRAGPSRRLVLAGVVATGGVLVVGSALWLSPDRYRTTVGESRDLRLEDGSRLVLDTDTRVEVAFRRDRREIRLMQGQLFLDVAHDPDRPLVVSVDDVEVRALGTQFNVRMAGAAAEVTLVEGRVEVAAIRGPATPVVLSPGEQVALVRGGTAPSSLGSARAVDPSPVTSWTDGRLIFEDARLSEAIDRMNRYTDQKLVLAEGVPDTLRVSGTFRTRDPEAFAAALSDLHGLDVRRLDGGRSLLSPNAS